MKARILVFALVVAIALALNLARLSLSIAQTGEDTLRARLAMATVALKTQLDLLDARLSPRAVAEVPELIEATRTPADPTQPLIKPDERALRAAASALSPEPDLVSVATAQGAIVSRRAKPAVLLENPSQLPLAKAAVEGAPVPVFATFDGAMYRMAAARVPGNAAAAVVGTLIDDRFALQLKSQVDADVTLLQGGKVIASSLQGDERARVQRWAAAPAPGFGVLRVNLPLIGTALSGKLPRGAPRYAVRGALVPIDGGVQAALTIPASPYFTWLARYQAFYLLGIALFIVFSVIWALLARLPAAAARTAEAHAPAPELTPRHAAPSLDVGEPRPLTPPTGEVPWSAADAELVSPPKPAVRQMESLDPEMPAPAAAEEPAAHPIFGGDAFTPTPGEVHPVEAAEPQPVTAEEVGLVEATPEAEEEPASSGNGHAAEAAAASGGDFSFGSLLEETHAAEEQPPPASPEAEPQAETAPEPQFPGDEPTRVEPVSAALIDKLRERDEEAAPAAEAAPQQQGWGALVGEDERTVESAPPAMPEPAPPPEAPVTMQDFSMPAMEEHDPDEAHWRETFDKFKELKSRLGEPSDRISFEKFAAKLKKNRADLMAKHNCKAVRFSVYEKDGKAAIKASAIR